MWCLTPSLGHSPGRIGRRCPKSDALKPNDVATHSLTGYFLVKYIQVTQVLRVTCSAPRLKFYLDRSHATLTGPSRR